MTMATVGAARAPARGGGTGQGLGAVCRGGTGRGLGEAGDKDGAGSTSSRATGDEILNFCKVFAYIAKPLVPVRESNRD